MDFNFNTFYYNIAEILIKILYTVGIASLILLIVVTITGVFLYIKFRKKFIAIITAFFSIAYIILLYLCMPAFILKINTENWDVNNPGKYINIAAKLTPITLIKAYYYGESGLSYWGAGSACWQNSKACKFSDMAIESWKKSCGLFPPISCYAAAENLTVKGDYDSALYFYDIYNKTDPASANSNIILIIRAYVFKKDYKTALEKTELMPETANKYAVLADIYLRMNDYENALKNADKAVKKAPKYWEYAALRAKIYNKMGEKKQFMANCKTARRNCPQCIRRPKDCLMYDIFAESGIESMRELNFGKKISIRNTK